MPRITESVKNKMSLRSRLYEGALILSAVFIVYFLIALASYHVTDIAWSTTGDGGNVLNAGGRFGAWLSDVTLYLLGYLGYLMPFFLAALLVLLFRLHYNKPVLVLTFLFSAGGVIFFLAGTSLLSLYSSEPASGLPLSIGGALGNDLSTWLVAWLNKMGAVLLLTAAFLIGFTLLLGVSWLNLFKLISRYFYRLITLTLKTLGRGIYGWFKRSPKVVLEEEISSPSKKVLLQESNTELFAAPVEAKPKPSSIDLKSMQAQANPNPVVSEFVLPKQLTKKGVMQKKRDQAVLTTVPSLDLLDDAEPNKAVGYNPSELSSLAKQVEMRLAEFGIAARVVASCVGPVVTRFELELAPGVKVSRITTLAKDLARALSVSSVRVVEVIPGKSVIGLEIPNTKREVVRLKEIFQSPAYQEAESLLSLALGKDIAGHAVVVDIAKMPHLLVAGTTGSGKSVSINAMLLSILMKASPEEVKLLMIDPKMLELSVYEGIPHLLAPVVTDMKEAANVLRWSVAEMDRRYRLMSALSVRNLAGYNQKVKQSISSGKPLVDPLAPPVLTDEPAPTLQPLPQIVIVIDELADMMMVVGKKVEELIARIAQKARAAGIHMVLATQRPSVDVITGLIKANIPTRIAFQVSSRIDSRTILDQQGAEHLLGHGDMLYLPPGTSLPVRIHGAFVSDEEVLRVVAAWKEKGEPTYLSEITDESLDSNKDGILNFDDAETDPLYDQAVNIVLETKRASISLVQRRLKIGYNRAARILEAMERAGLVSGMDHNGSRELYSQGQE